MIDFVKRPDFSGTRSFFWRLVHGTLFWKYVVLFVAVMSSALITNSLVDIWFTYQRASRRAHSHPERAGQRGSREDHPIHQGDRRPSRLDDPSVLGDAGHGAT